jgi:hypothetical protein
MFHDDTTTILWEWIEFSGVSMIGMLVWALLRKLEAIRKVLIRGSGMWRR